MMMGLGGGWKDGMGLEVETGDDMNDELRYSSCSCDDDAF